MKKLVGIFASGQFVITQLALAYCYIFSIIYAFRSDSFFAPWLTIFTPPVAQIFWFFRIGTDHGFLHHYCIAWYVALAPLCLMTAVLVLRKSDPKV